MSQFAFSDLRPTEYGKSGALTGHSKCAATTTRIGRVTAARVTVQFAR